MAHTALVLGDQLMRDNPALEGAGRVVFVESLQGMKRLRTHRRRVHLVLSAMRHFAAELRAEGRLEVVERRGASSLAEGLEGLGEVVCAHPNAAGAVRGLERLGVRLVPTNQFLTDPADFAAWARSRGRRRLVMEDFYRAQRRRFGLLLREDGEPEGGRWNFDRDNRRPPPRGGLDAPDPWRPVEDDVDAEVRRDLDRLGLDLLGADGPRLVAATPAEADQALERFVADRLPSFGPWQDAMVPGERTLFHSLLSAPMNLGVLDPLRVVRAAEAAYRRGEAPLGSVEGFVRQIVGWREYMWGTYWLRHDRWPGDDALDARRPLPAAYAQAGRHETGWNCLDRVLAQVGEDGYAHHIERLMVLGNVLLIAGVQPWAAVRWFQSAFVDGAEWVMAPNAAGMSLYADGGTLVTKPYAGGGNYINRMSGFCPGCRYEPNVRTGPRACPVTALYWDFMARNRPRLEGNRRLQMAWRGLDRMGEEELAAVRERAARALDELEVGAQAP